MPWVMAVWNPPTHLDIILYESRRDIGSGDVGSNIHRFYLCLVIELWRYFQKLWGCLLLHYSNESYVTWLKGIR